ncbi:hydroxyacid dehydrogenase [Microbacterium marmarense]|uniref:Hydroxyacid dehydrogenase n=1 Tax=Microbacterium marmarense TaxID=3122051 RepID=A0ABU8LTH6_9MICO
MPHASSQRPIALVVMEEARRAEVYPEHVLAALGDQVRWARAPMTREELLEDIGVLDAVEYLFLGWGAPELDERLLQHAPSLKLVLMAAGSIRATVSLAFWRRRIPIVSAAAANALPVAEFSVAQIVLSLKHAHRVAREMADPDQLEAPSRADIPGVYRRSVALLSLGAIGRLVAERLAPFDLDVFAYDPFLRTETARTLGVTPISLEQAFAACDVVSCHMPLLPETRGAIGEKLLSSLKPGAVLINTSRGAVIDEPALIEVLGKRPDITALLDVTTDEPVPTSSPLRRLPNAFLTSHSSGSQGRERWRLGELVLEEFERHRSGVPLLYAVTEEEARSRA